jgi:hypothetical protein
VEPLIAKIATHVETSWILRIDDDECPSGELLEWVTQAIQRPFLKDKVVGFSRRWLQYDTWNELRYYSSSAWYDSNDPQYRLYCKDAVQYRPEIHTPGFFTDSPTHAPSDCILYHFDWILRSKHERIEKMSRYDKIYEGAGTTFSNYYLPEDVKHWDYTGVVLDRRVHRLASRMRRDRFIRRSQRILSGVQGLMRGLR